MAMILTICQHKLILFFYIILELGPKIVSELNMRLPLDLIPHDLKFSDGDGPNLCRVKK